ncbi:hypothetical protein BD414DRAFT_524347 [Trametes punicea]|nr:hypothetical protein BD414DRAFT_524347 [Trametes punicea]
MSDIRVRASMKEALVASTLREVGREYYTWEFEHCSRTLASLAAPKPSKPKDLPSLPPLGTEASTHLSQTECILSCPLRLKRYCTVGDRWECFEVSPQADIPVTPLESFPAYESCTPIGQNILHGDDSNFMPFVPLADDPSFDHEDHVLEYRGLAWQEPYRDSDTLEIVLESARRLNRQCGLSAVQIDSTEVLPLTLATTSVWGTIWTGKQNDPIDWPGSSKTSHSLQGVSPPPAVDLRSRLQDYLTLWCPIPDCVQALCFSHSMEQAELTVGSYRHKAEPFRCLPANKACNKDCILNHHAVSAQDDVEWSPEELSDLQVIAHVGGATVPCDLARLCRKPCYEVAFICKKHNDFGIPVGRQCREPRKTGERGEHDSASKLVQCDHPGQCSPDAHCPCFLHRAQCSRTCRCSRNCPRRWKGCKCIAGAEKNIGRPSKTRDDFSCVGRQCPCRESKRECDPEVCSCCTAGGVERATICRNMQIQRGRHKLVEVKQGSYGLGLFLLENAKAGDLITEYIGELIYEPTFLSRSQVAAHIGRSYVFGLNKLFSVDATTAGNPARFINHAESRKANVAAIILLVNDHQRIGVFARRNISAGTELFMDYGPEYPLTSL